MEYGPSNLFVKNPGTEYVNLPNSCGIFISGVEPQRVVVITKDSQTIETKLYPIWK